MKPLWGGIFANLHGAFMKHSRNGLAVAPSRALKTSRRDREAFSKPSPIPMEASWSLLKGFARRSWHLHLETIRQIMTSSPEYGAYLRHSSRVLGRRPFIYLKPPYAIGSVPSLSGHAIAYRWRSLPRVRRHKVSKPQGSSERTLPSQVNMDQLICASLSHTHYWYEVVLGLISTDNSADKFHVLIKPVLYVIYPFARAVCTANRRETFYELVDKAFGTTRRLRVLEQGAVRVLTHENVLPYSCIGRDTPLGGVKQRFYLVCLWARCTSLRYQL